VGNVTEACVLKLGDSLKELLNENKNLDDARALTVSHVAQIPEGKYSINLNTVNKEEVNSAINHYYQIGPSDIFTRALALLAAQFMSEKIFDQLRTKESLGYVVSASFESSNEILGFNIVVESAFHPPKFVSTRIEAFLDHFPAVLESLTEAEFNKQRLSLVEELLAKDENLRMQSERYAIHLQNRKYQFYRAREVASYVNTITQADIVMFCQKIFIQHPRLLSVSIHGKNYLLPSDDDNENDNNNEKILDVIEKRESFGYFDSKEGDGIFIPELIIPQKVVPVDLQKMKEFALNPSITVANPDTLCEDNNEENEDYDDEGGGQNKSIGRAVKKSQFYQSQSEGNKLNRKCERSNCSFCIRKQMPFSLPK